MTESVHAYAWRNMVYKMSSDNIYMYCIENENLLEIPIYKLL